MSSAPGPARQFPAYRYFDLVMALFVTVLIVSNVASSAKIIDWGFSVFGVRIAFDGGTILFPISYIFGDVLTEVYGYRRSRRGPGPASSAWLIRPDPVDRAHPARRSHLAAVRWPESLRRHPGRHVVRRDRHRQPGRLLGG